MLPIINFIFANGFISGNINLQNILLVIYYEKYVTSLYEVKCLETFSDRENIWTACLR